MTLFPHFLNHSRQRQTKIADARVNSEAITPHGGQNQLTALLLCPQPQRAIRQQLRVKSSSAVVKLNSPPGRTDARTFGHVKVPFNGIMFVAGKSADFAFRHNTYVFFFLRVKMAVASNSEVTFDAIFYNTA